jgi:hypothetical protein
MSDKVAHLEEVRERLDREDAEMIEVCAGDLPRLVREAEQALIRSSSGIYQRGGQLVRIVQLAQPTEKLGVKRAAGSVIIAPLSREYLALALARAARWKRYDRRTKGPRVIDPPAAVASSLLAIAGEWRFPVLTGLTAAPTLRADGSLLAAPGFDPLSGLFGAFEPGEFPPINPKPTREQAQAALDLLDELFNECLFAGGDRSAHASVAIAATITAAVRHALPTAPAFGIGAYKASSGKTTLARTISQVCTGREPPVMPLSEDEAELRKCLLGILIAGDACVLIDNVARPVDSASLCAMLTNATYSDRVLGVNQKVVVPTASTWLITGNHLEFVGDLTTRVLLAVLDPQTEHPEAREFKRDLAAYVTENRGRLLAAALSIPLAYLAADTPTVAGARSRFTEWDRLVRRPMLWLGAADPLETQEELRAGDPVRESLTAVLHAWHESFEDAPRTVAELVRAATAPGQSERTQLLEALQAVASDRSGTINSRRLGRYLVRNLRRIENGMRLEDMGSEPLTHRRRFRVAGVTGVSGVMANPTRGKRM